MRDRAATPHTAARRVGLGLGLGLALVIASSPAIAGELRDAARVCGQIRGQLDDPNRSPDEVATWIKRDDRTYTPAIAACLCAAQAPGIVHRAVRAHLWSDTFTAPQRHIEVYVGDPSWSAEQEIALHVLAWIDSSQPRKPFHVLPTQIELPAWFDLGRFVRLMGEARPGVQLLDPASVIGGELRELPRGPLQPLLDRRVPDTTDLSSLEGTTPAVLWLDVSTTADGALALIWSLRDVVSAGPSPERDAGSLTATPRPGVMIADCAAPDPAAARAWDARVADAARTRPFDLRVELGLGGFTGYPGASGTSLQAASATGLGNLATTSFPDRAVFEAASGLRIPIGLSLRWRYAFVGFEIGGRLPLQGAQPTHRLVLGGDAWNAKALYSLDLGLLGGAKVDIGPFGVWAGIWAGGAYSYAAVRRSSGANDQFAVSGFGTVAGPRVGFDVRTTRKTGLSLAFVSHLFTANRVMLAPFLGGQATFWVEP